MRDLAADLNEGVKRLRAALVHLLYLQDEVSASLDQHSIARSDIERTLDAVASGEIKYAEHWVARIEATRCGLIPRLLGERMGLAVASLPADIRLEIIELVVSSSTTRERDLVQLSHLNREWRAFIMASPTLWSFISVKGQNDSLDLMRHFLDHSRSSPLSLELSFRFLELNEAENISQYLSIPSEKIAQLLAELVSHMHRWYRVDIQAVGQSAFEVLRGVLASRTAPILDALKFDCLSNTTTHPQVLFPLHCPRLRLIVCNHYSHLPHCPNITRAVIHRPTHASAFASFAGLQRLEFTVTRTLTPSDNFLNLPQLSWLTVYCEEELINQLITLLGGARLPLLSTLNVLFFYNGEPSALPQTHLPKISLQTVDCLRIDVHEAEELCDASYIYLRHLIDQLSHITHLQVGSEIKLRPLLANAHVQLLPDLRILCYQGQMSLEVFEWIEQKNEVPGAAPIEIR